jgi:hypothetical protein
MTTSSASHFVRGLLVEGDDVRYRSRDLGAVQGPAPRQAGQCRRSAVVPLGNRERTGPRQPARWDVSTAAVRPLDGRRRHRRDLLSQCSAELR